MIKGLNRLCVSQTGLTFAAKISLDGKHEGRTLLYELDKYPYGLIGPARFLWKPVESENDLKRRLWIWVHPAMQQSFQIQILNVFHLHKKEAIQINKIDLEDHSPISKRRKMDETKLEEIPKQKAEEEEEDKDSIFESDDDREIKFKTLKDQLVRFKLIGPLSTTILSNTLQTVDPDIDDLKMFFF